MKKKMQINKKKEERRGTQEKMLEPAKSAKSAKAANTGKQTKSEKSSKPAKSSRPAKLNKPAERADAVCPYAKKCGGCDYQGMPYEKQLKEKQAYVQSRSDHSAKCCRFWGWTSRIIIGTRCTPYLILKKSVAVVPAFVGTVMPQTENRETAKRED